MIWEKIDRLIAKNAYFCTQAETAECVSFELHAVDAEELHSLWVLY